MKKVIFAILLFGGILTMACQGPNGPAGPPGPQGPQGVPGTGVNLINEVFEVEVNFTAANGYFEAFDLNPPIEASDVVLVYLLWEVDGNTDIWRPLPQTNFVPQGILQYTFDFTTSDFGIFMEANFALSELGPQFTDGQIFRVVLIPGDFMIAHPDLDTGNYETVVRTLGIATDAVQQVRVQPQGVQ